jgi:hypothetical protein
MARRTLTRVLAWSSALALLASAGRAAAQAEAAPPGYEPPPGVPMSADPARLASEREARAHLWVLALQPRFVVALGDVDKSGLPRIGWGAGVSIGRAVFVRGRARFGLGLSFSYERQQHERVPPPSLANGQTTQWLSHAAFSADLRLDGLFFSGVMRPWVTLGPAMSVAAYANPPTAGAPDGVSIVQVLGGLRAAAGIAAVVASTVELGGRVECVATFGSDPVDMPPVRPLVPGNFSVGVDVGFRF